ncbi:hypothetical protein D8674_000402 [Pyrus ussuriensis x Pyrus communis]|uniref:Uncharacterized protein n=1 Tax=Pyrus ussuriensis x Pyrus communis TaxID=2448454 RepID=A0A5N5F8H2_9ROSA|nr:hypothetical protein D8674_000402 [Pyrus ussuriensis x Pyrus communis]
MEQIWEALTNINDYVDKLQKTLVASRAKSHANFVVIEKRMKNLKNSSGTTPQTQIPASKYGNISIINPEGEVIMSTTTSTLTDIGDPSKGSKLRIPQDSHPLNTTGAQVHWPETHDGLQKFHLREFSFSTKES